MNPVLRRILTALAVAALVTLAVLELPRSAVAPVVGAVAALAAAEYAVLLRRRVSGCGYAVLAVAGAALVFALLSALALVAWRHGNLALLYVLAAVKLSDMGGFAFGLSSAKLMKGGNHKLCPTVSPNKSWEGLFGSCFASVVLSLAFIPLMHLTVPKAVTIGFVAALVGTAGDLVESKFKRWVGVKDSSAFRFTNGMGGVLDMVDSLLFAPWVILLILERG